MFSDEVRLGPQKKFQEELDAERDTVASQICREVERRKADREAGDETPEKYRVSYLTVSQAFDLSVACQALRDFGYGTFHVGSSLTKPDYHDVDLRCILPNAEFDAMFPRDSEREAGSNRKLLFLNTAISEWIAARTGLPIDFQFQRMTDANDQFPMKTHRRNGV